jgi:hypothetical protein
MARARNLKPAFFKNYDLADAGMACQLLFAGLWCLADREGRLEDRPRLIKAELFPYYNVDVNNELTVLKRLKFVDRYTVDGINIIEICNFKKHQNPHNTEKHSELPTRLGHDHGNPHEIRDLFDECSLTVNPPLNNGYLTVNPPLDNVGSCSGDKVAITQVCNSAKHESTHNTENHSKLLEKVEQQPCNPHEIRITDNIRSLTVNPPLVNGEYLASLLIPSLLIPDSLNKENNKKKKPATSDEVDFYDVPEKIVSDYKKLRKIKRAAMTQTAIDKIKTEAEKAGISLADALTICCARGWIGFDAEWLNTKTSNVRASTEKPEKFDPTTYVNQPQKAPKNEHEITINSYGEPVLRLDAT